MSIGTYATLNVVVQQNPPHVIKARADLERNASGSNMSYRQPITQSDPPHPSGLIRAVNNTGRTRGSSATPAPAVVSPTPNRGYQAQVEQMSRDSSYQGNRNYQNASPSTTIQSTSSSQNKRVHDRNMSSISSSTQQSVQSPQGFTNRRFEPNRQMSPGIGSFQFPGPHPVDRSQDLLIHPKMTVSQLSAQFQARLADITSKIRRANGIDSNAQGILVNEVRKIGQEFNDAQRRLQHEWDKIRDERNQLYNQVEEADRQLRTAIADRDRANIEKETLQAELQELRLKAKKSCDRLSQMEQHWKKTNEDLVKELAFKEEQLRGKRALWMDSHPGSSARRDAMSTVRDPFTSPTTSQKSKFDSNQMGTMASPPQDSSAAYSAFGAPPRMAVPPPEAPKGPRHRPKLPTGKAHPAVEIPTPWGMDSSRFCNTEPGDPPPSMALVLHSKDDDPAPEYQAGFATIYALIEGWVKTYSSIPNLANDQAIARSNDILWAYMMNCTYPGHRQDSHTHVMTLLNDLKTRYWFIMRMAVTYCVKDIMSIDAFYKFSDEVDATVAEVKKKLQERGLANEARQNLIDRQARAVQSIISSKDYQSFRSQQLNYHTKRLRDMLGPLLNSSTQRAEAGRDLGAIAVKAWELSVKMHTSHLTFQVFFPETASKFNAATMIAKDQPNVDAMQLQIHQNRLKLVITPVVTMRDDRGTTIKAKNLHHSTVLTMG